jgi:hypothetical protein
MMMVKKKKNKKKKVALFDFRPDKERENSQTESDPCLDPVGSRSSWTRR